MPRQPQVRGQVDDVEVGLRRGVVEGPRRRRGARARAPAPRDCEAADGATRSSAREGAGRPMHARAKAPARKAAFTGLLLHDDELASHAACGPNRSTPSTRWEKSRGGSPRRDPDGLAAPADRDLHRVGPDREAVLRVRGAQHELHHVPLPDLHRRRREGVPGARSPRSVTGPGRTKTRHRRARARAPASTAGPRGSRFLKLLPPCTRTGRQVACPGCGRYDSARCGARGLAGLRHS